jgi:hypothetical protein
LYTRAEIQRKGKNPKSKVAGATAAAGNSGPLAADLLDVLGVLVWVTSIRTKHRVAQTLMWIR